MKTFSIIISVLLAGQVSAQTTTNSNITTTTPPPPYYTESKNALTYNSVNNNTGTPMVSNPLENNNPSVQASIPINNKPSSLEVDMPQNSFPAPQRIVNNNAQQNTTVKNKVTEGTPNSTAVVYATSISSDSIRATAPAVVETSTPVVKSTVIYNLSTGVDASKVSKSTAAKSTNGNTYPIRQTYVSESVVTKFKNIYGDNLYDIRLVRSGANNVTYIIRTIDNGAYKTMYLDEDGVVIQ
ncbi:hypothetical protein [Ferruginibacter sp. HRS2-29]|uniref:hypothetical protein n=1 Tax=Ferruginibacter sp. HRS2-29 TaxID=2487334 RepID=UPI0020CF6230|nr:hypothetical protein [Ferruginibacter sp. HRS2-29]MCP9750329.1 hypothetical protein [Ferruginibacter sp. HRS2-29]